MTDSTDDITLDTDLNEEDLRLTTIDNPYSPKDEYDMWKKHDVEQGYETESYIARLIVMHEDFDADDDFIISVISSKVVNDIIENDVLGIYKLI